MAESGGPTDDRTDDIAPPRGARDFRWIEDEAPNHAVDAAGIELGVVKVVSIVERDALGLLDAGENADLVALAIQLVDGVVPERVDKDVPASTDEHVIGRRQCREANFGRRQRPERAALVGDEDAPGGIDRGTNGTHHAARALGRGLAIRANTP